MLTPAIPIPPNWGQIILRTGEIVDGEIAEEKIAGVAFIRVRNGIDRFFHPNYISEILRLGAGNTSPTTPSKHNIIHVVCRYYHVTPAALASRNRTAPICAARFAAIILGREAGFSWDTLASWFGRDRCTAMYAYRAGKDLEETDRETTIKMHIMRQILGLLHHPSDT